MTDDKHNEPIKAELPYNHKILGIVTGFVGWFVINGIVWRLVFENFSLCMLPLLLNTIGLVILFIKSRSILVGALAAYVLNLIITLITGGVATAGIYFAPFFTPGITEHFSDVYGCEWFIALIIMIVAALYVKRLWGIRKAA
jgi:hypothetical protein